MELRLHNPFLLWAQFSQGSSRVSTSALDLYSASYCGPYSLKVHPGSPLARLTYLRCAQFSQGPSRVTTMPSLHHTPGEQRYLVLVVRLPSRRPVLLLDAPLRAAALLRAACCVSRRYSVPFGCARIPRARANLRGVPGQAVPRRRRSVANVRRAASCYQQLRAT